MVSGSEWPERFLRGTRLAMLEQSLWPSSQLRRWRKSFFDGFAQGRHHHTQLLLRGTIRWHQHNDVPDRARQHTARGHGFADADANAFAQGKRFAGLPVLNQFDSRDEADLADIADVGQRPER